MTDTPREFQVGALLGNRHVQTLGAAMPWHAPRERESRLRAGEEVLRLPLPGGDGRLFARARWQRDGAGRVVERLTVIVLHGIAGTSESRYMLRAASSLFRAGFHVVRLNVRGAGEGLDDAPALYHAGLTEDPAAAVRALEGHAGVPKVGGIALLGFSLGGGTVLKLAGEWGASEAGAPASVCAVATVSAALDLSAGARAIHRLRALPYRAYVVKGLMRQGLAFAARHPGRAHYDLRKLRSIRTIYEYDAQVVCPMHGFENPEAYYKAVSAGQYLPKVRLPTLLVHADDDPMVPADTVRPWLEKAPANVKSVWSRRGGHVGWFADLTEDGWVDTWAMQRVVAFLRPFGEAFA